jgi:hypothetical protein
VCRHHHALRFFSLADTNQRPHGIHLDFIYQPFNLLFDQGADLGFKSWCTGSSRRSSLTSSKSIMGQSTRIDGTRDARLGDLVVQ